MMTPEERKLYLKRKRSREYYYKKQAKKGLTVKKRYLENEKINQKPKPKPKPVNKSKPKPVNKSKKPSKQYVKDAKLKYEIILSKGKGKPTENLKIILYKICQGVNKKFVYNDEDIRYDVMMHSYIHIINNWYKYDEKKYDKAFPYITEIVKRSQAKGFNIERYKGLFRIDLIKENITYTSIPNGL